jgi:hypothetical protein
MLKPEQYDEFAQDLDVLAEPLRAIFPAIAFMTLNLPQFGPPGIVVSARRTAEAEYPFPISILIRWREEAIKEYLEADAGERQDMRDEFGGSVPEIVANIEAGHGGLDWHGRSQASARGIIVDLDQF